MTITTAPNFRISLSQPGLQSPNPENTSVDVSADTVTLSAGIEKPSALRYIAKGAAFFGAGGLLVDAALVPFVGLANAAPFFTYLGAIAGVVVGVCAHSDGATGWKFVPE